MKLIAAKCPNCGAKIKVNKEDKIYTCDYCRFDLFLDSNHTMEDKILDANQAILEIPFKKPIQTFLIIKIAFIVVFLIIFISVVVGIFSNINSNSIGTNSLFADDTGVYNFLSMSNYLDEIISNINETGDTVIVSYNGTELTDINQIIALQNEINNPSVFFTPEYLISNEKNAEGGVDKIIIESLPPASEDFNRPISDIGNMSGILTALLLQDVIQVTEQSGKEIIVIFDGAEISTVESIQNAVLVIDQPFTEFAVTNEKDDEGYISKITITTIQ